MTRFSLSPNLLSPNLLSFGVAALIAATTPAWSQDTTAPTAAVTVQTPAVAPSPRLEKILTKLSKLHSLEGDQVVAAVRASSDLTEQLNTLAAQDRLKDLIISGSPNAQFGGDVQGTRLVLTVGLLANLRNDHPHADIVPGAPQMIADNTVFVLGHLALHMLMDADVDARTQARMAAQMQAAVASGGDINATDMILSAMNAKIDLEAEAYFQGWNDVVDAATRAKGAPLTAQEVTGLLMNLRYRSYFLKAMPQTGDSLTISDGGRIEPDTHNIAVLREALKTSDLPDIH